MAVETVKLPHRELRTSVRSSRNTQTYRLTAGRCFSLPCDWKLDMAQENVSEEIKLLVAKIIAAGTKGKYPKKVLEDVPWLVELVDRHSYGKMKWSDERPPRGEEGER